MLYFFVSKIGYVGCEFNVIKRVSNLSLFSFIVFNIL